MTVPPVPQASIFGQQIPQPAFASVRVEFADGTWREFHVRKPLRAEVDITRPSRLPDLTGDLGALPPGVIPPELPEVKVRLQAGLSRDGMVMTLDSRVPDPRTDGTRLLALLVEALRLMEMYGRADEDTDDLWRDWERKARLVVGGVFDGAVFTPDELRAAMDRLGWYAMYDGRHPADRIIADIQQHRSQR